MYMYAIFSPVLKAAPIFRACDILKFMYTNSADLSTTASLWLMGNMEFLLVWLTDESNGVVWQGDIYRNKNPIIFLSNVLKLSNFDHI